MKIFEKGKIGSHEIKNKLIMSSLTTNLSTNKGEISQKDLAFYKERIEGGVGAIITGMMRIDDFYGNKFPYQPSASHSKYISGLKMLTELAHSSDVKIFAQLNHPGAQTFHELNHNLQQISAKPHTPELINQESRAMTNYEIEQMVSWFAQSAIICEQAGFDGVEIHAGHGYLLHSFLANGNGQVVKDVIRKVAGETSHDFALILRLNFEDFTANGIKIEDAISFIKELEDEAVDAIDITCGVYESMQTICDSKYYGNRWKDEYIARIRKETKIPLIADNNIKTPAEAEAMLADNLVDFIGLARPLLADPAWVKKAAKNEPIAPCISCSHCFRAINAFKMVECPVNPHLGRESLREDTARESNNEKTMAIIGAGPAGLQLAISLAKKNYKVVVFEKNETIGGKLKIASKLPHKYRIDNYLAYLSDQIDKLGVDMRLGGPAKLSKIKALDPYQVFIATGAIHSPADKKLIYNFEDILNEKVKLEGKNILIIGGGENGLELADLLADNNHVTIAEATNMIGREMEYGTRMMLIDRLKEKNIKVKTNTMVELNDDAISLIKDGESTSCDFDAVIKSIRPLTNLAENASYLEALPGAIILGDADRVGNIFDATRKAVELANRY